jgi:hypothetical protein
VLAYGIHGCTLSSELKVLQFHHAIVSRAIKPLVILEDSYSSWTLHEVVGLLDVHWFVAAVSSGFFEELLPSDANFRFHVFAYAQLQVSVGFEGPATNSIRGSHGAHLAGHIFACGGYNAQLSSDNNSANYELFLATGYIWVLGLTHAAAMENGEWISMQKALDCLVLVYRFSVAFFSKSSFDYMVPQVSDTEAMQCLNKVMFIWVIPSFDELMPGGCVLTMLQMPCTALCLVSIQITGR